MYAQVQPMIEKFATRVTFSGMNGHMRIIRFDSKKLFLAHHTLVAICICRWCIVDDRFGFYVIGQSVAQDVVVVIQQITVHAFRHITIEWILLFDFEIDFRQRIAATRYCTNACASRYTG